MNLTTKTAVYLFATLWFTAALNADRHARAQSDQTQQQDKVSSASDTERKAAEGVGKGVGKLRQEQQETKATGGLSWRVGLLPYLGHQNLYNEFHHDEPWNSPHNRQLISKMPQIYNTRGNRGLVGEGKTTVVALVSPRSVVTSEQGGIRLNDIPDGASKTILFVGANSDHAVTWTKPQDIRFDPKQPLEGLGRRGYFQAVLADGSVHQIPSTISAETMRRLVYRDDGEPVTMNFLR